LIVKPRTFDPTTPHSSEGMRSAGYSIPSNAPLMPSWVDVGTVKGRPSLPAPFVIVMSSRSGRLLDRKTSVHSFHSSPISDLDIVGSLGLSLSFFSADMTGAPSNSQVAIFGNESLLSSPI